LQYGQDTRGVANIIPGKSELEKLLHSGKKLNIYCGFDVTAPHLHVGNAVPLRKLQQFVELGHHVTFLIGDFTTLIGDTSDKETERPVITEEQIEENWQNFASQAGKILDLSKISVRRNSEWLDKLTPRELIKTIRRFSLNDFISRELIKKRLSSGGSVNLAEAIYPVLQGYDSYFLDTDIQVGATDQTFNMQAGRTMLKQLKSKDSFVMSFNFLTGTDGRKMSKSWGNAIWLDDSPTDVFGKVMSVKDELIEEYFTLATNLPLDQIPHGGHPMELKKKLAWQITSELHSSKDADSAQKYFENTFENKQTPDDAILVSLDKVKLTIHPQDIPLSPTSLASIAINAGTVSSNSEFKRLVNQGAVEVGESKITDPQEEAQPGTVLKIGKRRFIKIQ